MWINSFIVAVNCVGRVKQRCLSSSDTILTVLAFSRCCFLLKTTLQTFCSTFYPEIYYQNSIFQAFRAVTWFLNSSNQWFAACLCVFYCVKIANFSNPLFICLKFKISRLLPWLLLGSVLLSLFSSLPFLNAIYKIECDIYQEISAASTACTIIVDACPSVHSIILILSNPKLKKTLIKVLHYAKCKG
ncbi:taste receptor type 2 member 40-like [Chelydra serpentina]|uniref:Taste receptor type 2 member 40 n=1 Tax=Chelydra serpentina TaxID=8475 RepID=A0A8T1T074_CHESE|nr:taste receptor type 2 member 40-like [Chelydra serpentina]